VTREAAEVGFFTRSIPLDQKFNIYDTDARIEGHRGYYLAHERLDVDTPAPSQVVLHQSRRMEQTHALAHPLAHHWFTPPPLPTVVSFPASTYATPSSMMSFPT
jgi:hypothetical protein